MRPVPRLSVSPPRPWPEDTKRRFISENPTLWADIEADLKLQLAAQNERWPVADRVRGALVDLMPAGRTGAEDVVLALGISRSTLQRRLREEGTSYQEVLYATRRDMAIRYLTKTTLRIDEIASVLAYRDANSFWRSFRRWTGQAPVDFRAASSRPPERLNSRCIIATRGFQRKIRFRTGAGSEHPGPGG